MCDAKENTIDHDDVNNGLINRCHTQILLTTTRYYIKTAEQTVSCDSTEGVTVEERKEGCVPSNYDLSKSQNYSLGY